MAEPQTAEQRRASALCQELTHMQGWTEVVLGSVMRRLAELDRTSIPAQLSAQIRLEAVARKDELLNFVNGIYKLAQEPNPFDVARQGLWSHLAPPPPAPTADTAPALAEQWLAPLRSRTARTGSVA